MTKQARNSNDLAIMGLPWRLGNLNLVFGICLVLGTWSLVIGLAGCQRGAGQAGVAKSKGGAPGPGLVPAKADQSEKNSTPESGSVPAKADIAEWPKPAV